MPNMNQITGERLLPELTDNPIVGRNQQQGAQSAVFLYDFTRQGGAISTIALIGDPLPPNCTVYGGLIRTIIAPVGVGASIAVQLEAANDIVNSAAISGTPWSTLSTKAILPVFTAGSAITTTVSRAVKAVITTTALTAGKFQIVLFFQTFDG